MSLPLAIIPEISLTEWYQTGEANAVEEKIVKLIIERFSPDDRQAFLHSSLKDIPDPELMKGIHEAVDLILEAIRRQKQVLIVGDYDVDGITATVLLIRFFEKLGLSNIDSFIPSRFIHGYGLTLKSVDEILSRQPDLIITVDNGITAKDEIQKIQSAGIDVIVTDHHLPQDGVVPDCITINPKQDECSYPFKELSGVGVAFILLIALRATLRNLNFWQNTEEPNLLQHLDLVAIGTIADQVPLLGLNRILVKFGLDQMTKKIQQYQDLEYYYYLKVFAEKTNVRFFDSNSIAFKLAPMLNATGRMKDAMEGVGFLLSDTEQTAISRYKYIERLNDKRKKCQKIMVKKAMDQANQLLKNNKGLFVYDDSFHEGLIGVCCQPLNGIFPSTYHCRNRFRVWNAESILSGKKCQYHGNTPGM